KTVEAAVGRPGERRFGLHGPGLGGPRVMRRGRRVDDVGSCVSHGVSPAFVREMRDAFDDAVSNGELISLASNDVRPEYVRDIRDAFGDVITAGEIIMLASNDVDADYARQMRALFDEELTAGEL